MPLGLEACLPRVAGAARTARPVRLPDGPPELSVFEVVVGVVVNVSPEVAVDGGENPVASIAGFEPGCQRTTFLTRALRRVPRSSTVVRDYG